jgi:autotransporter-associated beta strand protein
MQRKIQRFTPILLNMKTPPIFLPRGLHAAAVVLVTSFFALSPSAQAQSFWDGGSTTGNSWGTAANWVGDVAPTFGTSADLVFNNLTRPDNDLGNPRTVRSITYGADIDGSFISNTRTFNGGTTALLTLQAASGNATITIDADATGNITLGWNGVGTAGTSVSLGSNLEVTHNGAGVFLINRNVTGTGSGITKLGTGTMSISAFADNTFSGAVNVNAGRLIMGNTNTASASADFLNASAINLGGGTLEMRTTVAVNKVITNNMTISSASTLVFNNTTAATRSLTLNTGSMALDADLTVQNISSDTTLSNATILNRALTGTGDLIVDGYNTFTSGTADFSVGRVALGGNNSGWSGDLVIREGSAQIFGDTALGAFSAGTGGVVIGETANSAGAVFLLSASTPTAGAKTLSNNITVRSGGFRALRGGSDHTYNINGNITLDGDLNVHNGLFFMDKNMILNGVISGAGDLVVTKGTLGGFTRLTGSNPDWTGDLVISQGALNLFGTATTPGTGDIVIGATGDATAASLTFSHTGSLTYTNDIIVNSGGTRSIQGNSSLGINVTFSGGISLNGDLTVDHTWSTADRRINLNGPISGSGGLIVNRSAGSTETTLRLAGTNTFLGGTTVSNTASLALASTASLASNVTVQAGGRIGGPGTINANLTLADTANFFFYAVGLDETTYVPMTVTGAVTLGNNFGIANIVGGSRGEVVDWANTPDGTYTLIASTPSSLSNIQNFGSANYATIAVSPTRYAYFQGTTGLQIVVSSTPPTATDPFVTWSGSAVFTADANNDGVSNGVAWFLGAADVNEDASNYVALNSVTAGALVLEFDCLSAADRTGSTSTFFVQYGGNITTLASGGQAAVPGTVGTFTVGVVDYVVTDPGAPGGLLHVVATIPVSEAVAGKLFGRVIGYESGGGRR